MESTFTIGQSIGEILNRHVTLHVREIDCVYPNVYVLRLQVVEGVLWFIRRHRGYPVASTRMVEPIMRWFGAAIEKFVHTHAIPLIGFEKVNQGEEIAPNLRRESIYPRQRSPGVRPRGWSSTPFWTVHL